MFTALITGAALTLPCLPLNPGWFQEPDRPVQRTMLTEDAIGMSLYRPVNADARALIKYAIEFTESRVRFIVTDQATGEDVIRHRDRFVQLGQNIAVQGDDAGRQRGVATLAEIDGLLAHGKAAAEPKAAPIVRTVQLRSMSPGSAMQILDAMTERIQRLFVAETSTLVLRGAEADVARAQSLLLEVDRPAPQMTLHVTLLEEVTGAPGKPASGDVGQALGSIMPGKQFHEAGRFMVRGSVAGSAPLELASSFGSSSETTATFALRAASRSWDDERKVLTLGSCHVQSARPRFLTEPTPGAPATGMPTVAGFDEEGFTTDLSLNLGQETVVGALGGSSLLVVLRFTVD